MSSEPLPAPQPDATQPATQPVRLPPRVPQRAYRPAQSNVPDDRRVRDRLKTLAQEHCDSLGLVPPVPMAELREHAADVRARAGVDAVFDEYIAVLLNNAAWRDTLAQIPYERRLLLIPKCLRVEEHCPAPFDEFGLLCKECGLCSIQDFTVEAERLGYAVLVAEGSAIVTKMIETGRIEAVVGVSCLNVLEKSFPHMEAAAVPGVAIPLLQDDCINCNVDEDWVWDVVHLSADDRTYRMDLDGLRDDVRGCFDAAGLDDVMGPIANDDPTEAIARAWLAADGKRWRPFLTACVYLALRGNGRSEAPETTRDLRRLAVAVECFHKASLVHDDIQDGDGVRYGQPTVHARHGEDVAINVGDFLLGEGYRLIGELADAPAEAIVQMLRIAAEGHRTLCRGQGAELSWGRHPQPLSPVETLAIFRNKTAPAFEVALRLGAVLGGEPAAADNTAHEVLREYSEALGIAYQIRDDLDDHSGESDSDDVEDLRPSLLMALAHKKASGADHALVDDLWRGRQAMTRGVADDVRRIIDECGGTQKARDLMQAYEEQAVRSLRFVDNATLKGLLRRVVGKIFPRTLIEGYCSEFEARNAPGGATGAERTG